MEQQQYLVQGIKTTISSKTGKAYSTLYLTSSFGTYEKNNSARCEGQLCVCEGTSLDVTNVSVGDTVALYYTKGYQDRAVLSAIEVL